MFINSELYEACPASCNHTGANTRPNTHRHAGLSLHCQHPALTSYQPSSLLKPFCNMSKCIWQCPKSEAFRLFFVFKVLRFLLTMSSCERERHLLAQKVFDFGMTWQIDFFHNVLSPFALGHWQWGSVRGHLACVQQTRDNRTKLQQQGGHNQKHPSLSRPMLWWLPLTTQSHFMLSHCAFPDLFTPLFTCQYSEQKLSVIQGVCQKHTHSIFIHISHNVLDSCIHS